MTKAFPKFPEEEFLDSSKWHGWRRIVAEKLEERIEKAEIQMKAWQPNSREWFRTAYQHGYFVLVELLESLK